VVQTKEVKTQILLSHTNIFSKKKNKEHERGCSIQWGKKEYKVPWGQNSTEENKRSK
jgi:hypothetical protein